MLPQMLNPVRNFFWLHSYVSSNFVKSACARNFLRATPYQHLSIFKKTCMKYVQKHVLKENLGALISRPVCGRTHAQLGGNIGFVHLETFFLDTFLEEISPLFYPISSNPTPPEPIHCPLN